MCNVINFYSIDYCPEYNEEGMRVQENYAHRCSSGVIPCPITYTSDKLYKCKLKYTSFYQKHCSYKMKGFFLQTYEIIALCITLVHCFN